MSRAFQRLTRPSIRKLLPGESITEHGITFQRLSSGDGVYTVNVMVDGQRIHRVVGRESEGTTRTQAEQFIAQVRQQAREGRLNLPRGRKLHLGFREAANRYIERLQSEGGRDVVMKRRRLSLHLVPFFGETPLSKIASFDVERYKKTRLAEQAVRGRRHERPALHDHPTGAPTKPGTVNRELAALSHLFNKAVEWGWIDRNPVKIKRLKEESGRITYLTVQQAKALIEAAMHDQNSQVYPFIVIGLETGMRRMEMLSIRREHIDLDRRTGGPIWSTPKCYATTRMQPTSETHMTSIDGGVLGEIERPDNGFKLHAGVNVLSEPPKVNRVSADSDLMSINLAASDDVLQQNKAVKKARLP